MADLFPLPHTIRTMQDAQFRAESAAMTAPGMSRPAPGAAFRQIAPQLHLLTVIRIGKAIDGQVADAHALAFISQLSGDLLG